MKKNMPLCLVVLALSAGFCLNAWAQSKPSQKKSSLSPLVIDQTAPLLLEETAPEVPGAKHAADNTPCQVCHVNFASESLAQGHAKAGVGCVQCHGDSFAHRNDENNTTPPEKMYAAGKIDPACQQCHEQHNVAPQKVVERWIQQGLAKKGPAALVCTDCHGNHRLALRTVRWEKTTGKLIGTNKK